MEADWGAEIGAGLPVIVVPWEGFVDLRLHPEAASNLAEAAQQLALVRALQQWNAPGSPCFTSKCDVWTLSAEEIDPLEFDSSTDEAQAGTASYVDVIAHDPALYASFDSQEAWAAALTGILRRTKLSHGRVDVTIRAAEASLAPLHGSGFALTVYCAGCGADFLSATAAWEAVLETAVAATIKAGASLVNGSRGSVRDHHADRGE